MSAQGSLPSGSRGPEADGCAPPEAEARVIAGRYRLRERLGEGGHGEVWIADDLVLGEQVAVKLLLRGARLESARIRREISALRMLRLPGVVRLLDEGTDHGEPFLVMERVHGEPFPGGPSPGAAGAPKTTVEVASIPARVAEAIEQATWKRPPQGAARVDGSAPGTEAARASSSGAPPPSDAAYLPPTLRRPPQPPRSPRPAPSSATRELALANTAISELLPSPTDVDETARPSGEARLDGAVSFQIERRSDSAFVASAQSGLRPSAFAAARSSPRPAWTWNTLAERTVALLETLARVHAAGVIHRDLKPANILVDDEGRPTLLDFGISYGQALGEGLTEVGTILGTPAYLAPEQILGKAVDARTDLYAVGVIVYRALSGQFPHESDDPQALLRARLLVRAQPLEDVAPEVPAAIADLVNRLLARVPDERPRSAAEVLTLLYGERRRTGGMGAVADARGSDPPSEALVSGDRRSVVPGAPGVPRAEDGARAAEPRATAEGAAFWQSGALLPRLGGDAAVRAVLEATRAGASIDVVGASGSGRSRCLRDAAAALAHDGRRVVWTRHGRRPFAALQPLVGALEEHASRHLDEVTAWIDAEIREALGRGVAIFADDADRIDLWSAAALARCRRAGPIVRGLHPDGRESRESREASEVATERPGLAELAPSDEGAAGRAAAPVVRLAPLDEASLRPLFAGPDRLFHLCEDAARALWERTEGVPARIDAEVALWVRAGLARWDGPVLVVDRHALGRLGAGLQVAPPLPRVAARALHDAPHLADLLMWLNLAGPSVDLARLAGIAGQPLWRLEAEGAELVRRGAARRLSTGAIAAQVQADCNWTMARRRAAHRAIAEQLRPGEEGRLLHLLAADDGDDVPGSEGIERAFSGSPLSVEASAIAGEAVALARQRALEGHLGPATAALADGLLAVRRRYHDAPSRHEVELLAEWVKIAFAEDTPQALDRVLYELCRAIGDARVEPIAHLEGLVRAALARSTSAERALSMADALPPFADIELERRRHGIRVTSARRESTEALSSVLPSIAAWAEATDHPLARASLAGWRGLLCYQNGAYDEAARLHAEAAEGEPWLTARAAAILNGASALLEAFRHREAAERAAAARDLAARYRHPYYEGRAEWLLRSAMYRMGEATVPDMELVSAVARVGVADLEALVCFTEASVAWRAGAPAAAPLARRAAEAWKRMGKAWAALLAQALELSAAQAESAATLDEVQPLAEQASRCADPRLGLQVLGLLVRACPEARASWQGAMESFAAGVPRHVWDTRMDVLSVAEALAPS